MTLFHAVVAIDHHHASVLQFDAEHVQAQKVKAHGHYTRQHGSAVRSEHEFFGHVCDALDAVPEVLLTGAHTALADFRHYVEKHRPQLAPRIVGWEVTNQPSENQLVALARRYFLDYDRGHAAPRGSVAPG